MSSVCERVFAGGLGCGRVRACRCTELFMQTDDDDAHPWRSHSSSTSIAAPCGPVNSPLIQEVEGLLLLFATLRLRPLYRPLMSHLHSRHRGLPPLPPASSLPLLDVGCSGDLSAPITNSNISERSTARATLGPTRHVAVA